MDNNKLNRIFAESDCITNQMMMDYLDGRLSGKLKNVVEMHIESCELCKDELEGLSVMKDKNRLSDIIYKLNHEITLRMLGRKKIALFPQVSAMAAIILLLVGFTWFFFYIIHISPESLKQKEIAQALENEKKEELQKYDKETQTDLERSINTADTLALIKPEISEYKISKKLLVGRAEKTKEIVLNDEDLAKDEKEKVKADIVSVAISEEKKAIVDDKKVLDEDNPSGNAAYESITATDSEKAKKGEGLVSMSKGKRAVEKDAKNLFQQGMDAFERNEYKIALDLFLKSSEKDTSFAVQNYYIGQCYQNLGNNKKAVSYYDKVIVAKEKQLLEPALWNKSQIQLKIGQNKQAIESLNQTKALNGSYAIPAQNQIDSLNKNK